MDAPSPSPGPHLLPLLALLALASALYFVGSARTGFQGADELRYGQIAKELGPGRDLFLLRFNGSRYSDKPPPYFWAVAVSYKLFGFSPLALRVPGVLSGVASVLLVYFLALSLGAPRRTAFLSAAVLMLMPRFIWILRWGRLDVPMCMFVYASMFCFARAYFGSGRRLGGWGLWICLGFSFAIKGPAGPIVILGSILTFLFWQGERARWRELFHWGPMAAALAINLAWLAPIVFLGDSESTGDLLVRQNLGRVLNPWRHLEPPWYYLKNVWHDAFPAMLFFLAASIFWFRRRKRTPSDAEPLFGDRHCAFRFLFSWFAFTVLFFSVYPPKRPQYLLPMYPAVAILSVFFLDRLRELLADRRQSASKPPWAYLALPSLVNLLPIFLVVVVLLWREELAATVANFLEPIAPEASQSLREADAEFEFGVYRFPAWLKVCALTAVALASGAVVVLLRRRSILPVLGIILGVAYGALFIFFAIVVPPAFSDEAMKRFSREIGGRLAERPELVVCVYGNDKPYYNIYGDFFIAYFDKEEDEAFREFVRDASERAAPLMVILEKKRERTFASEKWLRGLDRRESSMRGDAIVILESPPR